MNNIFNNLKKADTPATTAAVDPEPHFTYHFAKGAYLHINCEVAKEFSVTFYDGLRVVHSEVISSGMYIKVFPKYFIPYRIAVQDMATGKDYEILLNLKRQTVVIEFGSSALGDAIAWMPYLDEFQKKHDCKLIVAGFHNELFHYPNIIFAKTGTALKNVFAWYTVGWFYLAGSDQWDKDYHRVDPKSLPMQATAAMQLGVPYVERKPKLVRRMGMGRHDKQKIICIATHATLQAKYWNHPTGWQKIVDHFTEQGYVVVNLSREEDGHNGNVGPKGCERPEDFRWSTIQNYLRNCQLFIGLGSGLTWLSWAMNTPTVLISGFSAPWTEMQTDILRISARPEICNSCFNWIRLQNDGDWNWCPRHKGTSRQFECTTRIHPEYVIEQIENTKKLL